MQLLWFFSHYTTVHINTYVHVPGTGEFGSNGGVGMVGVPGVMDGGLGVMVSGGLGVTISGGLPPP